MNPRLLTPAIVLVSFGATFGLASSHAGLWHRAPAGDRGNVATAPLPATMTAAETLAPPSPEASPEAAPEPVVTLSADPPPADDPPATVTPETQVQASAGFLAARDRAAEHGARSH